MTGTSGLDKSYLDKVETIASHHEEDRALLYDAFNFAAEAHREQKRKSGEPYIVHPISVAFIIDEWGFDTESIMAGFRPSRRDSARRWPSWSTE